MRKKVLDVILAACVLLAATLMGSLLLSAAESTQISTSGDLLNLMNKGDAFASGGSYKLTADIDMSGVAGQSPIGSETYPFCGTFDGNGKTIRGLNITGTAQGVGLFGAVKEGTTIKNLTIDGSITGGLRVGGIVGTIHPTANTGNGDCLIQNCTNKATVSGTSRVGGIVGIVVMNDNTESKIAPEEFTCTIDSCINLGGITYEAGSNTEGRFGGIVGSVSVLNGEFILKNSRNIPDITVSMPYVGGIAGNLDNDGKKIVRRCLNKGNIEVANGNGRVGGIAGNVAYVEMSECENDGDISMAVAGTTDGKSYIGGVIGYLNIGCKISDCLNRGEVHDTSGNALGGIFGAFANPNQAIQYCLNTGKVSSDNSNPSTDCGSVCGIVNKQVLSSCYYVPVDGSIAKVSESQLSGLDALNHDGQTLWGKFGNEYYLAYSDQYTVTLERDGGTIVFSYTDDSSDVPHVFFIDYDPLTDIYYDAGNSMMIGNVHFSVTDFAEALEYAALIARAQLSDVTVHISGLVDITGAFLTPDLPHQTITLTGDGGDGNGIRFADTAAFTCQGAITFRDITFARGDAPNGTGAYIYGQGHKLVFDTGIRMSGERMTVSAGDNEQNRTVSDVKLYVYAGYESAQQNEVVDTDLTVRSGSYWVVSGLNKSSGITTATGQVHLTFGKKNNEDTLETCWLFGMSQGRQLIGETGIDIAIDIDGPGDVVNFYYGNQQGGTPNITQEVRSYLILRGDIGSGSEETLVDVRGDVGYTNTHLDVYYDNDRADLAKRFIKGQSEYDTSLDTLKTVVNVHSSLGDYCTDRGEHIWNDNVTLTLSASDLAYKATCALCGNSVRYDFGTHGEVMSYISLSLDGSIGLVAYYNETAAPYTEDGEIRDDVRLVCFVDANGNGQYDSGERSIDDDNMIRLNDRVNGCVGYKCIVPVKDMSQPISMCFMKDGRIISDSHVRVSSVDYYAKYILGEHLDAEPTADFWAGLGMTSWTEYEYCCALMKAMLNYGYASEQNSDARPLNTYNDAHLFPDAGYQAAQQNATWCVIQNGGGITFAESSKNNYKDEKLTVWFQAAEGTVDNYDFYVRYNVTASSGSVYMTEDAVHPTPDPDAQRIEISGIKNYHLDCVYRVEARNKETHEVVAYIELTPQAVTQSFQYAEKAADGATDALKKAIFWYNYYANLFFGQ